MIALVCAAVAAVTALIIGRFARPIGTALGLLDFPDDPGGRKLHAGVTPLVGGLTIATTTIGAIVATVVFGADHGPAFDRDLARLGLAVAVMFLIGAADDRFELSVRARLTVATLVLAFVVASVPDFAIAFVRFVHAPTVILVSPITGTLFSLLCLVGLLNAVNMADGKNGIVIGLALIWSAFLMVHLPAPVLPVMAAAMAALAVLFGFNLRGRLFLGDGGSYAVSALFGLLAIYTYNHAFADIGADDIALLFAVPVFDALRLLVGRAAQRKSPFAGGRDHLHHYLYARVGWPRGLIVYLMLVAVPVGAATLWPGTASAWLAATLLAYIGVLAWAQRRP